ncbi:NAD(P)-binding protein [Ascodesmis nigricans]|uniref:NAD(P)-binding protein n=1 Tax=Ascodesmis nigricans TaxID=341454 RepID=A0A4S2N0L9_9PEZI|nr:NAD(P)-binding protein [Ascodesmis nigricans]
MFRSAIRRSLRRPAIVQPPLLKTKTAARTVTSSTPRPTELKPGTFARTDPSIEVQYPEEHEIPSSKPVRRFKRTLSSFSLEGKTAIVTGGARGLGYVMTQALVESGADVAIVDLNGEEAAAAAKRLYDHHEADPESPAAKITSHTCDVSSVESVSAVFKEILAQHSNKVDILVTSAGFCENFPAEDYPPERLQKLWEVNVNGTYFCSTELAKHLKARGAPGSVVMIGSMSGAIVNVPQPQAPYNASKAAVRHLASSFAVEWAPHGIRVNCISPGYMLTDLTKKILEDRPDLKTKWNSLIPQGKMGVPADLMGAVVFLASDAAQYVTGAELRVDGGYTAT